MRLRDVIFPHQIGLDVLGDRHGPLTPVGQVAQAAAGLKDPVGGGHKGEFQAFFQQSAQKGGDTGVGVDDVRLFRPDNVPQHPVGLEHTPHVPPVHGHLEMADAGGLNLRHVDPAVGGDHDFVPLALELLGQLYNMGLRAADVQAHSGHQYPHPASSCQPPCHTLVTTPVKEEYLV